MGRNRGQVIRRALKRPSKGTMTVSVGGLVSFEAAVLLNWRNKTQYLADYSNNVYKVSEAEMRSFLTKTPSEASYWHLQGISSGDSLLKVGGILLC